jgi:UDP-N-acetylglucosamine acyltransferase
VRIDDWAILGGFTLVHQFCKVGAHCFTAMNSVINMDVPPYVMVSGHMAKPHGLNSEGLKRRGFSADALTALRRAYRILYRSNLTLAQAIEQLKELATQSAEIAVMVAFLEASNRGIVR